MERGRGAKVLGPKAGTVDEAKAGAAKGPDETRRTGKNGAADKARGRNTPEPSESGSAGSAVSRTESAGSRAGDGQKREKKPKDKAGSRQDKGPPRPVAESGIFAILPKLKSVPAAEQGALLEQKMEACKVVFNFLTDKDPGEKEGKKHTLSELVEHITANGTCLNEPLLTLALDMIGANLFRALTRRERSHVDVLDPEDDSPIFDAAWVHLELVYEFLLRVVKHSEAALLAKLLGKQYLLKLLELFDSEDPRERESLKTTVNRIYTRLAGLRTFIRKGIHNVCLRVIYENGTPSGVAELLEILARIITGFTVPLKPDHRELFFRALGPLHKLETLGLFHSQLVECQRKFIEKDSNLALDAVLVLFRFWPVTVAAKQLLFLNELEEMLVEVPSSQLPRVQDKLAKRLAACVSCQNSDVAERALNLCKNGRVTRLIAQHCRTQFPIVISSLYGNATAHWANPVHKLTFEVLKLLMETDPELFDQSSATHRKQAGEVDVREAERERRWAFLRQLHDRKRARSGRRRPASGPRTAASTAAAVAASTAGGAITGETEGLPRSSSAKDPGAGASSGQGASSSSVPRLECPRPGSPPLVLAPNCELLLPGSRYGIVACWDSKGVSVELGFQALLVDKRGKIISAVHDSNSFALQGAVWHTRTEPDMGRTWADTTVWVKPPRLPQVVVLMILVAVAYSGGHLSDITNGVIKLVEESPDADVARFEMAPSRGDVGPVACFRRNAEGGWSLTRTEEFVRNKRHFMDILEPTLGRLIREMVPSVPKRHKTKLAFGAMEQGALATLPQPPSAKWLFVSIGWDIGQAAPAASAASAVVEVGVAGVFLDEKAQEMGAVCAEKAEHCGARHCGGGILGEGLLFDLDAVPQEALQIALVMNLRSDDTPFEMVQKPHCSVVDPSGAELMRYTHTEVSSESGLVLARFIREAGRGRWAFQALGASCSGTHWKDAMKDIQTITQKAPHELRTVLDDVKSSSDTKRSIVSL